MRHGILALSLLTAIALASCTVNRSSIPLNADTSVSSATPTASATPPSDPSFPGEAAHLSDEASDTPVTVRAEPSDQARSVLTVSKEEVVRVIDSTRDSQQRMWYRIRHRSGVEGWVMGLYMQFIGEADPSARPVVVMPGEIPILAEPSNDATVVGHVRGGEVLTVSRSIDVPELDDRKSTWLKIDRGWVSAEFLFQPACLRFNGNPMQVVNVAGATVRSEPNDQAQEVDRLEGGETVIPLNIETNEQGEWLKTEQGWVNSKALFLPTCQSASF